jgi:hypothetical protein
MHMLRPIDAPGDDLPWTGLFTGMLIGNINFLFYLFNGHAKGYY